jgi:hypothetical protein
LCGIGQIRHRNPHTAREGKAICIDREDRTMQGKVGKPALNRVPGLPNRFTSVKEWV